MSRSKTGRSVVLPKPELVAQTDGWSKFGEVLLRNGRKFILPKASERKSLGEAINNHLFDLDGPTQLHPGPRTPKSAFFSKVFYGFVEIFGSHEMLDDILFLIGRFPYSNTRLSREGYLQFLVEAYFSEVFVLHERLKRYLKTIERLYRKDSEYAEISATCQRMSTLCAAALEGVLKIRHGHIHEGRLREKGLDRLRSIGLLANNSDGEFGRIMKGYYRAEYIKIRRTWQARLKENNKSTRRLLDVVAKHLFPILFDRKTSGFRYPSRLVP
jgi:hypothetical protein